MNVFIIHKNLQHDELFINSLVKENNIVLTQTQLEDNFQNFFNYLINNNIFNITNFILVYHYPGYNNIPFFSDIVSQKLYKNKNISNINNNINNYINNNINNNIKSFDLDFIYDINDIVDTSFGGINETLLLQDKLNIDIRYSLNDTGNAVDWILESHNVNIKELYFNQNINN